MFKDWLDELLSKVDLVSVISKYVPLTKKGKTYWGCCPFHHEKEPSFAVNDEMQFYHCFGCKESGNAITFLKKIESIEFMDAVKILAKEAHMAIPEFNENKSKDAIDFKDKEKLYSLMRDAARHYHDNLMLPQAKLAQEYIQKREIPYNLVRKFGLGFSVNGNEIIEFLESKGYNKQQMKQAGIIEQKADDYYDVFYGRLIFPIINNFGQVVAFGGRLLNMSTHLPVKYRNSSQTPIFDKSKTIYGVNLVKKKKQKENVKYMIMTEGYMDVISLHKAGFDTAVASMGTALTYQQAKQIKNICDTIYICYDGDSAGQKATLRGLDILRESGLNVKVVSLPNEMDPDDFIKAYGKDKYMDLLRQAQSLPEFKINSLKKDFDLTDPEGKSSFSIEAIKVIKQLKNPVEQEEFLKVIQKITGYSMDTLRKQADLTDIASVVPKYEVPKEENQAFDAREIYILACIVMKKEFVKLTDDIYPYLKSNESREIYTEVLNRFKNNEYDNPSVLFNLTNNDLVKEVINYQFIQGDDDEKYHKYILQLKCEYLKKKQDELTKELENNAVDKEKLLELQRICNEIQMLKRGGNDV